MNRDRVTSRHPTFRISEKNSGDLGCIPVTPKMLVKALEGLKDSRLLGIYFPAEQVAEYIKENYPCVQQDFTVLLLEVSDKLSCAASADILGYKQNAGYYPYNLKQTGARLDTRSELTFWVLYKRILDKRHMDKANAKKRALTKPNTPEILKKKIPKFKQMFDDFE